MDQLTKSKRILVLTPRFPYPVIGGDRLRIYEICKDLAKTHRLTLLSLCDQTADLHAKVPDDGVFDHVERVYLPTWRSKLNALLALPTRTPLQVAYYRSGEFRRRLNQLMPEHDVCLAHLVRTGDYVREMRVPKVLEMTDAISLNYQRVKASATKRDWKSRVFSLEADRLLRYERQMLGKFNATALVSHVDRQFLLKGREDPRVMICSNGVDLEKFPFEWRNQPKPVIVFIGNMLTVQNKDACEYFIAKVLPVLRAERKCVFRIVGRMAQSDIKSFESHDGVEVAANVADIREAVSDAFAAVAPMRLGAGIQNKVLEYMALGLPTITTTVGLEGLHAKPGVELLVADDAAAFAAQLKAVHDNSGWARSLALAARGYVERHHCWSARLEPLRQAIERASVPTASDRPIHRPSLAKPMPGFGQTVY